MRARHHEDTEPTAAFGGATCKGAADARSLDTHFWECVSRLLERATSLDDLRSHRLVLLAVTCWRELGRPIPGDLIGETRGAAMTSLAAPLLLQLIRDACDGPIVLLKGPETAACYPQPWPRPFSDIDVLVPDAVAVQRALLGAGFKSIGDERLFIGSHQLAPLQHPGFPLLVEVHTRPHWIEGVRPPPVNELFDSAVKSVVPIAGISALPRAQHAVLLAAHAWAHAPLGSLSQLIDIAAARQGASASETDALATAWGIERIWRTTTAAVDTLLFGSPRPWPLRTWARHLGSVRERTVLETHLGHWFSGFSAFPFREATRMAVRAMGGDVCPNADEDWPRKLRRTRRALKNAFVRRSQHDRESENPFARGRFGSV